MLAAISNRFKLVAMRPEVIFDRLFGSHNSASAGSARRLTALGRELPRNCDNVLCSTPVHRTRIVIAPGEYLARVKKNLLRS